MRNTRGDHLLDIRRIYLEPAAAELARGREILERYPAAERVEVDSHQRIPELYGDEANVARWVRIKTEALVLGVKKSLTARPNGRSSDFIAPSTANGCAMACAYCYVPRRKGYSNPITVFANIEQIIGYLGRHAGRQGVKPEPNQVDPHAWVYDIGENSDCSVDATISANVRDLVELFRGLPNAKASLRHQVRQPGPARLGSAGPHQDPLQPDARRRRQAARHPHLPDRGPDRRDRRLRGRRVRGARQFQPRRGAGRLAGGLGPPAGQARRRPVAGRPEQLAAEVIFLTHNDRLHEVNLGWHPKAEEVLWRPDLQQPKRSQTGGWNVRYRTGHKGRYVTALTDLIADRLPCCRVRYAF